MATRRSANWAKRFGMAMFVLVAAAPLSLSIAHSATVWSPRAGLGLSEVQACALAQQPPPEVTTEDGGTTVNYRFEFDGLPFIFTLKHSDTGHGPQMVVGTSEQVNFWFSLGLDWEKWRAQGNDDTSAPQHRAYVVIEDPAGEEFETNGATGFIISLYALGSGAHNHYSPKLSGAYVLTGYINQPDNVVLRTTMSVEIVEPTAVPTVAEPTQAAPVARPTEIPAEPEPDSEFDLPPWVPIAAALPGAGLALWFLLNSGSLGPLPAGGVVSTQPAVQTTIPPPMKDLPTEDWMEQATETAEGQRGWKDATDYEIKYDNPPNTITIPENIHNHSEVIKDIGDTLSPPNIPGFPPLSVFGPETEFEIGFGGYVDSNGVVRIGAMEVGDGDSVDIPNDPESGEDMVFTVHTHPDAGGAPSGGDFVSLVDSNENVSIVEDKASGDTYLVVKTDETPIEAPDIKDSDSEETVNKKNEKFFKDMENHYNKKYDEEMNKHNDHIKATEKAAKSTADEYNLYVYKGESNALELLNPPETTR